MGTKRTYALLLAGALSAAQVHAAIVLNFDKNGANATNTVFTFSDLSGTPAVSGGALNDTFTVASNLLVGASGSFSVTWTAKDKSTPEDASTWAFGPDGLIDTITSGYGVGSPGEAGGFLQFADGEALLLSFDVSDLVLSPGASLVFSAISGDGESFRIFKRTGASLGAVAASATVATPAVFSDPVPVSGYESSSNVYDFAIVDAGWDGGGANRIAGFSVEVVGGAPLPEAPELFTLFTDNMVLQRNADVAVWGVSAPTNELTITFADQTKVTSSDQNGNWSVSLDPMAASSTPNTLTVSDGVVSDSITNVLVGDVWLASGQSNMDRPIRTYASIDPDNKTNPYIRLMNISTASETAPVDTIEIHSSLNGSWQECGVPSQLDDFSPAAYFFAAELQEQLNIPIGIIESAVGSTPAEKWTPTTTMAELGYAPDTDYGVHFNGMIYPLRNFTFKGVIWYQGESNSRRPLEHTTLFPALIQSWRDAFGRGDLPFYFAQLAALATRSWDTTDEAWPWLRESQASTLAVTNTRMIVLIDAGEYGDIHPQDKQTVGQRFALHAMEAEGLDVKGSSPLYSGMQVEGNKIRISFDHAENGLETREVRMNNAANLAPGTDPDAFVVPSNTVAGFAICGENRIFVEADAVITGNQVVVSSPYVSNPVAVRYGWKWFPLCNLYSVDGLPAGPFRTDSFEIPIFSGDYKGVLYSTITPPAGETMTVSTTAGISTITPVTQDGVDGYSVAGTATRFAYFATSNPDFKNGQTPGMKVDVLYFDQGTGTLTIRYDAETDSQKSAPLTVQLTDSGDWRVASVVLDDAYFANRLSGYDLCVQSANTDFIIGGVFLTPYQGGAAYQTWGAPYAISGDQELDQDSDRQSNYDEFLSGTNPFDAQSALRMESFAPSSATELTLQWQSVSGKTYRIVKRADLASGSWATIDSNISPTAPLNTAVVPASESNAFFRIELE